MWSCSSDCEDVSYVICIVFSLLKGDSVGAGDRCIKLAGNLGDVSEIGEKDELSSHIPVNHNIKVFIIEACLFQEVSSVHKADMEGMIEIECEESVEVSAYFDNLA